MSTHPNAMLILRLTPDDLARKTYRAILAKQDGTDRIVIGGVGYYCEVMESDYLEDVQISAPEGDIVVWHYVTYGYGETISWDDLVEQKAALEQWAKDICSRHKCQYSIVAGANYW